MTTNTEQERKKCTRCKVNLLLKDYMLKRDGLHSKSCFKCLEGYAKAREKYREKNKDKFVCEKCNYKCNQSNTLQRHIKMVHGKIKDFKCTKCEYKSSDNGNLQRHINSVHLKIKDHVCEYENCDMKFSENGNLQTHIKQVHDKNKDFKCTECEYKCSTNSELKRHIKICTGNEHISSGEYKVRKCLREMKIQFEHNTSYIVKHKQLLRWDFILYDEEDNIKGFIEYDGMQHFTPVCFNGISQERAEEKLRTSQIRDNIKNEFCKENNYPLLRIPYTEFGNIPDLVTKFAIKYLDWGNE